MGTRSASYSAVRPLPHCRPRRNAQVHTVWPLPLTAQRTKLSQSLKLPSFGVEEAVSWCWLNTLNSESASSGQLGDDAVVSRIPWIHTNTHRGLILFCFKYFWILRMQREEEVAGVCLSDFQPYLQSLSTKTYLTNMTDSR